MNKNKLIICSVLAIFIVAMSLSAVSANSPTHVKTFKINKEYKFKNLKKGDQIGYVYKKKEDGVDQAKGVNALLTHGGGPEDSKYHKLVKATVFFKKGKTIKKVTSKKVGGKTTILIKLKKGYKPYKIKIYYKNKK